MTGIKAMPLTSYIVRVYRCDAATGEITGTVEVYEQEARLAFHSFAELKTILLGTDVPVKRNTGDSHEQ